MTVVFDALEIDAGVIAKIMTAYPGRFTNPSAGVLRHTRVVSNNRTYRLPGGFTARAHQVEIQTSGAVQWMAMATSVEELMESGN
ncbi:hypothetical protein D3C86_1701160 [compost metagenome]